MLTEFWSIEQNNKNNNKKKKKKLYEKCKYTYSVYISLCVCMWEYEEIYRLYAHAIRRGKLNFMF